MASWTNYLIADHALALGTTLVTADP